MLEVPGGQRGGSSVGDIAGRRWRHQAALEELKLDEEERGFDAEENAVKAPLEAATSLAGSGKWLLTGQCRTG